MRAGCALLLLLGPAAALGNLGARGSGSHTRTSRSSANDVAVTSTLEVTSKGVEVASSVGTEEEQPTEAPPASLLAGDPEAESAIPRDPQHLPPVGSWEDAAAVEAHKVMHHLAQDAASLAQENIELHTFDGNVTPTEDPAVEDARGSLERLAVSTHSLEEANRQLRKHVPGDWGRISDAAAKEAQSSLTHLSKDSDHLEHANKELHAKYDREVQRMNQSDLKAAALAEKEALLAEANAELRGHNAAVEAQNAELRGEALTKAAEIARLAAQQAQTADLPNAGALDERAALAERAALLEAQNAAIRSKDAAVVAHNTEMRGQVNLETAAVLELAKEQAQAGGTASPEAAGLAGEALLLEAQNKALREKTAQDEAQNAELKAAAVAEKAAVLEAENAALHGQDVAAAAMNAEKREMLGEFADTVERLRNAEAAAGVHVAEDSGMQVAGAGVQVQELEDEERVTSL